MVNIHLLDTDTLIKILSAYTAEYNKKMNAGAEAFIDALKTKIKFLQKLIELRKYKSEIIQSTLGTNDLTTSKN
jgi:hypothetical protein